MKFVAAIAAILFYFYIFLSLATGPPLKGTASTMTLQREALPFVLFELLLICGVNEPKLPQTSALEWRTSSNTIYNNSVVFRTSVESLATKFQRTPALYHSCLYLSTG